MPPDGAGPQTLSRASRVLSERFQPGSGSSLERAFELFDVAGTGRVDRAMLPHVLWAALDADAERAGVDAVVAEWAAGDGLSPEGLQGVLLSDALRPQDVGRHFVALSLAEAETVRRILHCRGAGLEVEVRLRALPMGFATLDQHLPDLGNVQPTREGDSAYQARIAEQSLRFFDGELSYTDGDVGMLIRALQSSTCRRRQLFFEHTMGCRRRLRRKWEGTPLAKIFSLRSEFHVLMVRAQVVRVRLALAQRCLTLSVAFKLFNVSGNGLLKPSELWAALDFLGINADEKDVIDLVRTNDTDGDGNLSWVSTPAPPFCPGVALRDPVFFTQGRYWAWRTAVHRQKENGQPTTT